MQSFPMFASFPTPTPELASPLQLLSVGAARAGRVLESSDKWWLLMGRSWPTAPQLAPATQQGGPGEDDVVLGPG